MRKLNVLVMLTFLILSGCVTTDAVTYSPPVPLTINSPERFGTIIRDNVNIRKGPGYKYMVEWQVFKGFPVQILQENGDWLNIKDFEGDMGWVYKNLVSSLSGVIFRINGNLYRGPHADSQVIARVKKGVILTPIEMNGGWLKATTKGTTGWVMINHIWPSEAFLSNSYAQSNEGEENKDSNKEPEVSSGTAFFIGKKGYLVTNHHVVNDCKKIQLKNSKLVSTAHVVTVDELNDLAIIKSENSYSNSVSLKGGKAIRAGEDIITVGYPLSTLLGETLKVTTGNISAVTGIANNTSVMQITAPIQPGNSGGPVLDRSGNVVGVVSSKLNELAVAKATGSLPQNVNFAIKSQTLQVFLDTHGIDYELDNSDSKLESADIVEKAQNYTVRVTCYR